MLQALLLIAAFARTYDSKTNTAEHDPHRQHQRYTGSRGGVGSASFDSAIAGTGHGRGSPASTRRTTAVTGAGPDHQQTSSSSCSAADTQYDAELTADRATGCSTVRGVEGFAGREQVQGDKSGNDRTR